MSKPITKESYDLVPCQDFYQKRRYTNIINKILNSISDEILIVNIYSHLKVDKDDYFYIRMDNFLLKRSNIDYDLEFIDDTKQYTYYRCDQEEGLLDFFKCLFKLSIK